MSYGPAEFQRQFDVSRETLGRLEAFAAALQRWNVRINLVSAGTLPNLWLRHIADSAQLWPLRGARTGLWADLGSGAGFPGLVIAALAAEAEPGLRLTLVESDQRKAAFLAEAAGAMRLAPSILAERIETLPPFGANILSARALAPLDQLLGHAEKHLAAGGVGLFPKGGRVHKEIEDAAARWRFTRRLHPSVTEPRAAILEVGGIKRV